MIKKAVCLFQRLNEENIQYCHFKSNEHLDASFSGKTDFDILVSKEHGTQFERILLSLDFKRFYSQPDRLYPGIDDWLGFDVDSGSLIHLHVHYQLVTGYKGIKQYVLPWANEALYSACLDNKYGIFVVEPEFELIFLYTRFVSKLTLDSRIRSALFGISLDGNYKKEAEYLRNQVDPEKLEKSIQYCFSSDSNRITNLLMKDKMTPGEFRFLLQSINQVLKEHQRSKTSFAEFRIIYNKIFKKMMKTTNKISFFPSFMKRKVSNKSGLVIAFVGADGSGKSTVSREIRNWLSWKVETSQFYLGIGGENKNRGILRLRRFFTGYGKANQKNQSEIHANKKRSGIKIKRFLINLRYLRHSFRIKRMITKIHAYKLSGGIAILDRYPQVKFKGIFDGPKIEGDTFLSRLEYNNLKIVESIQPDIVFKLHVPLDIAEKRKPDHSREQLLKKIEILQSINFSKSKVINIDATQDFEEEMLLIKQHIWEKL